MNTPPVLALLAVPFIAWLAPGPTRRVIVTAWAVAALVVVPLSLGRSAWVGIAVALVAAELLLGQPILRRVSRWLGIGYRRLAVAATAATSLAVVVVAVTQLGTLAGQLDSRVRLWDQAVRLFAADPVSGAGPSTFGWARLTHVADYVDRVAAKDVHSVPLQTLADGGLVLAAGALVVLLAWVSLLVERWPAVDRYQRLAVAVMCGYAAFALLDDLAFLPTVTVLLVVLAAWAVPPAPSEPGRPWHPAVVPVVVIIAVAISLPSVPSMTLARLDAAVGREAAVAGDWATAIEAFRSAARLHPENAQLWMSIGLVAARAGRIDVATQAYEQARAINAGDPRPWGALAVLADDPEESLQLLEAASRRSNDPRYAYRLGDAYEAGGRDGAAARSYALAAAVWSDWWGAVPDGPREAAADHLQEAVAIVGPIGGIDAREAVWNAQLDLGHLASEAPAPWHAVAAAIQGEFAAARRALDGSPAAARTDQAAVAVARLACDRDAFTEATSRLAFRPAPTHPTDHPVAIGPPGVYREPELGDYQPISGSSVPDVAAWPLSFVEVPDCAW